MDQLVIASPLKILHGGFLVLSSDFANRCLALPFVHNFQFTYATKQWMKTILLISENSFCNVITLPLHWNNKDQSQVMWGRFQLQIEIATNPQLGECRPTGGRRTTNCLSTVVLIMLEWLSVDSCSRFSGKCRSSIDRPRPMLGRPSTDSSLMSRTRCVNKVATPGGMGRGDGWHVRLPLLVLMQAKASFSDLCTRTKHRTPHEPLRWCYTGRFATPIRNDTMLREKSF